MNQQPKVSVVVPIYNVEPYLERCIQSLLNQSLKDIEIILVDDGSPDHCPQMCDEYAQKDSRIKVIHKQNGGLSSARNAGLDIANGEYVAFVDSDDYTSTEAYHTLYHKANVENADIAYAGFILQKSNGSESECFQLNETFENENIANFLSSMIFDNKPYKDKIWMSVWNGIYKRELMESHKIRFQSERLFLSEDILFHTQLIPLCKKIICLPNTFYHYCYNGTSLTHSFNTNKIDNNFRLYESLLQTSKKYGLTNIDTSIQLFLINYTRGVILKGIILSDMSFQDKYKYCQKVYEYKEWKNVFSSLQNKKIPRLEKLGLYLIKYKAFFITTIIYTIYYKLLGKGKFE